MKWNGLFPIPILALPAPCIAVCSIGICKRRTGKTKFIHIENITHLAFVNLRKNLQKDVVLYRIGGVSLDLTPAKANQIKPHISSQRFMQQSHTFKRVVFFIYI